ncbi:hypothetical protein NEOLEDRAFT_1168638 [Neolentinus lepideus HHB14362 ss-1]|uniref:Uncharacterized protein n=1 Tax=Neolentinus lepideus HHB14362 ss-1 TaxID=1314782 RepID=A0A165TJP3_9AGAM|nr:hypothetical protein NEOLEDRAFT_1168638 [Neolentinus lepideus HHB14362 ss-1]
MFRRRMVAPISEPLSSLPERPMFHTISHAGFPEIRPRIFPSHRHTTPFSTIGFRNSPICRMWLEFKTTESAILMSSDASILSFLLTPPLPLSGRNRDQSKQSTVVRGHFSLSHLRSLIVLYSHSSTVHTTDLASSTPTFSRKDIVIIASRSVVIMVFGVAFITVRRKHKTQEQCEEDAEKCNSSIFSRSKGLIRPTKAGRHREHIITPFMGRRFSVVHIAPQYNTVVEPRPVAYQRQDGTWGVDSPGVSPTSCHSSVDARPTPPSPVSHPSPRRVASQPEMRARPQPGQSVAPTYPPGISRSSTPGSYTSSSRSSTATMEQRNERLREQRALQARHAYSRPPVPPLPPLPPPPPYTP